jgi:MerR HTH family regulatory protein
MSDRYDRAVLAALEHGIHRPLTGGEEITLCHRREHRTTSMLTKAMALNEAFPGTVSTTDAARRAGVTYRQLNYWIALGAIKPAVGNGGSGNPYRMTERQVEILVQVGHLHRWLGQLKVGSPNVELIRRVWESLENTGSFRYTDGPLEITLPWPAGTILPDAG